MQIKERTKKQISEKIKGMNEFLKIEYLEECLKAPITFNVKKFVQDLLIELYWQRKMFSQAAKYSVSNAEISVKYTEKIENYMKALRLYVMAGLLTDADITYRRALACGNSSQKKEIEVDVINFYKKQAEVFEKHDKRAHAIKVYEKLLRFIKDEQEKEEVKIKLIDMYEKVGKMREAVDLRRNED